MNELLTRLTYRSPRSIEDDRISTTYRKLQRREEVAGRDDRSGRHLVVDLS